VISSDGERLTANCDRFPSPPTVEDVVDLSVTSTVGDSYPMHNGILDPGPTTGCKSGNMWLGSSWEEFRALLGESALVSAGVVKQAIDRFSCLPKGWLQ
jgi:hypothetical protein